MIVPTARAGDNAAVRAEGSRGYLWLIAGVAALGGLLFGYDWVVIGGARPFYEAYFHLHTEAAVGWANSCALLGCFAGSLGAGRLSDRLGRKRALLLAALLFAISSVLTGWAYSFTQFIVWRIVGGVAIGLASAVSPMYIAEVSPAAQRGRLVSLNQLALVVGILLAQVANWRIARPIASAEPAVFAASWNVLYGWRWMFTAVAVPALVLLAGAPFLPESPRWLLLRGRQAEAESTLARVAGREQAAHEVAAITSSLHGKAQRSGGRPLRELLDRGVVKLLAVGIALAVLQQASGINILFNYAEEVYRSAGFAMGDVLFNIVITGAINLVFTLVAMSLVDRFGRRRLMLLGCVGIGAAHLLAAVAYRQHAPGGVVLGLTLCAIACYAMTLAPITWVLITELYPNRVRASAVSITVGALWVASFALTYTFPLLQQALGMSGAFTVYGAICLLGAAFVFLCVPETRGRSLEEIGADGETEALA